VLSLYTHEFFQNSRLGKDNEAGSMVPTKGRHGKILAIPWADVQYKD
jgi:hypothetical protein